MAGSLEAVDGVEKEEGPASTRSGTVLQGKFEIELDVNGQTRSAVVCPADVLLDTLRERLGLTGAKPGCENGDCGACTVVVDGWPIKSCMMLTVEAVGHAITTVEVLEGAPAQKAFLDHWAFQCGYCTSGFIMVCHALAAMHPDADDNTVNEGLQSNICRCTGYEEITNAARSILRR